MHRSISDREVPSHLPRVQNRCVAVGGLALLILLTIASCKAAGKPAAISPQHLSTLFATLQSCNASDVQAVLAETRNASPADPNWPMLTYLLGEVYLKCNNVGQAREKFRDLAVWAASDQSARLYKDRWGVSGLAAVGLWRWLKILDEHGSKSGGVDQGEVAQALEVAAALQKTRFYAGMVRSSLLPALPLIEEDVARRLAHIAWKAKRPETMGLFLDFLSIDSTGELDETDKLIRQKMLDEHRAMPARLDLFQSRRQLSRVTIQSRRDIAAKKLEQLWRNQNMAAEVRAEAAYELGNFYRQCERKEGRKEKREDVIAQLTSAFELENGVGLTAEKALYRRGMVQNSCEPKQPGPFFEDMKELLRRFPNSPLADDALYQIATELLFGEQKNHDQAFSYFRKLREFKGENNWLDSAYFIPAAGLMERGTDADLRDADELLKNYVEQFPEGPFRLRCLFWRGRIAEKQKDISKAQRFYKQIVDEAPYDYYGLRASMHLESGAGAISMALPRADSHTRSRLREAYLKSVPAVELAGTTPYHERLRTAALNGLYKELLAIVDGLGARFKKRIDSIPLQTLDENNLIPAVALMLSLRQDAIAARDSVLTSDNQLRLAGFLGRKFGDWPTAISMTDVRGADARQRLTDLQKNPHFLATAYPSVEVLNTLKEPLTGTAWQIDGSTALCQSLMYALIRHESRYYSGAISPAGALGLFQILPGTFNDSKDCRPGGHGKQPTAESYLFDPVLNARFWSCWMERNITDRTRDSIAPIVILSNAGARTLREWRRNWEKRAIGPDLELQLDTLRYPETSKLVREVLADAAIADAGGFFETGAATDGKGRP